MSAKNPRLLESIGARDFLTFVALMFNLIEPGKSLIDSWHIDHIAWLLACVMDGEDTRVIINVPPRSLKSILVSVLFPAFLLGRDPSLKIIVTSHNHELARKLATDFRRIVESEVYKRMFPRFKLAAAGDRVFHQLTTENGYRLATSVGATVTGQGADLIICDDPNRAKDVHSEAHRNKVNVYFDQELVTRLNDKQRGVVIIVMQRLHEEDLTGHVAKRSSWTVSAIEARATSASVYRTGFGPEDVHQRVVGELLLPEVNSDESLDDLRDQVGSLTFEAQYQQSPTPAEGSAVKRKWLRYADGLPETFDFKLVSWDLATTIEEESDYSVGTVWGLSGQYFYLLDVIRGRYEAPDLRRLIEDAHHRFQVNATIIEKAGMGHFMMQEMRRQSTIRPIAISVTTEKAARLLAETPKFEAGQVILPREAPWLGSYVGELLAFPLGGNDDQVDSTSQALKYLTTKMPRVPRVATAPTIERPRPKGTLGRRK